ncbi:MAG: alpha/beta hydrolase family protein [Proteobacteria bacterium]|nr:alpha/beta hydrolase family protein [Pseudomonadota bacterium]MCP4917439.1 alpha/beta hydrolase family protein [Pseudomonadota bacterium]
MSWLQGSWMDHAFGQLARLPGPLFVDGLGDVTAVGDEHAEVPDIEVRWTGERRVGAHTLREGRFVPPEPAFDGDEAVFWLVEQPFVWIHLPATGDMGPGRRSRLARPMLDQGVGACILEGPFYGQRTPPGQRGALLRTVEDLLRLTRGSVVEARALIRWLERRGHRVGLTGFSMGGTLAALAAAHSDPLPLVPMATGRSAVPIFTTGVLSRNVHPSVRAGIAEQIARADLDRFDRPAGPIHVVGCRDDAYVPRAEVEALAALYDAPVSWVSGGHVAGYVRRGPLVDVLLSLATA